MDLTANRAEINTPVRALAPVAGRRREFPAVRGAEMQTPGLYFGIVIDLLGVVSGRAAKKRRAVMAEL